MVSKRKKGAVNERTKVVMSSWHSAVADVNKSTYLVKKDSAKTISIVNPGPVSIICTSCIFLLPVLILPLFLERTSVASVTHKSFLLSFFLFSFFLPGKRISGLDTYALCFNTSGEEFFLSLKLHLVLINF